MDGSRDSRRGGDDWIEISAVLPALEGRPLGHVRSGDWSLALRSAGLPHRVRRIGPGYGVFVPPAVLDQALAEVGRFEAENPPGVSDAAPPPPPPLVPAGTEMLAVLAAAAAFYVLTVSPGLLGMVPEDWLRAGQADSGLILAGRWEMAVTALFLHGGPAHFLANAALGGVVLHALGRELRVGSAALLFVLAGGLGNLLNAVAHGPGHLSIGASTGVFGLVGGLAALRAARDGRITLRRAFVPVAAGVGLLAMLGAEGKDTDLLAHAFGFAAGLGLGLPAGLALRGRPAPGRCAGWFLGLVAAGLAALAWTVALGRSPAP
jgi:membrane associated rhomboid family serine protease